MAAPVRQWPVYVSYAERWDGVIRDPASWSGMSQAVTLPAIRKAASVANPTAPLAAGTDQTPSSEPTPLPGALQNVGNGRALLEHLLPGPLQSLIPKVITGSNDALALAIADLFWITVIAGVLGLACTLILRDLPCAPPESFGRR